MGGFVMKYSTKSFVYARWLFACIAVLLFLSYADVYAYKGDAFITPDSWNRHITSNGVRSSINGISFGDTGLLKMGYTTRIKLRFSDEIDYPIYQYARVRLSGVQVGEGEFILNLNMRGAYDNAPSIGDRVYHRFYDGLYASRNYNEYTRSINNEDGDLRIYQGNMEFKNVIPITDISLGRIYLAQIDGYKVDGANIKVTPSEYFNINVYYGLPVSYYSNLDTQVVGTNMEIPIESSGTRLKFAYSYFIQNNDSSLNTHVARARLDQTLSFEPLDATIYAEGDLIGRAFVYEAGFDSDIHASKTNISLYVNGQATVNNDPINNYVSLYEGLLGTSEYVMGGGKITQGIIDKLLIGVGYEGRYNFKDYYGDRDYHRVFGNIDLVGLIHRNNYLSLIVDYYNVPETRYQNGTSRVVGGFRMTQVFSEKVEAWMGVNVQNFQYRNSPIRMNGMINNFDFINQRWNDENTTLAYIGAVYKPVDWCALQLEYVFEYADLFKNADLQPDVHTIEMWANFLF